MKNISIKHTLFIAAFLVASLSVFSQGNRPVTEEIWVAGTCKHCKLRIEKAMDIPGVLFADYNVEEHTLELTYKPHKISIEEIHKALAAAGHDTKLVTAPDEAYLKVDECCRYRTHDCTKH